MKICVACKEKTETYAPRCPACGRPNALRDYDAATGEAAVTAKANGVVRAPVNLFAAPTIDLRPKVLTGIPALDEPLNGGVVVGQSVMLVGGPGVGKSTIFLGALCHLATEEKRGVYFSNEEPTEALLERAQTFGYRSKHVDVLGNEVADSLETCKRIAASYAYAVFDSMQNFADGWLEPKYPPTRFFVSRINKAGISAGENDQEHDADAVIYADFPPGLDAELDGEWGFDAEHSVMRLREARCSKNRQARGHLGSAQYTIVNGKGIRPLGATLRNLCRPYFDKAISDEVIALDLDVEEADVAQCRDLYREWKKREAEKKKEREKTSSKRKRAAS